ncbi:hypothetical protein EF847_05415 [Actinobacteria bacterium YIM 96077]|uniref:Uncharacterized protein n=1 Tax=Phytoactinopolyspora halophila TaxID=1981511 RepID=A0A329R6A3_9ACTN|nr:hypothetical protein [Phytoactinopolyspora halophila]AYY12229.1 hypothetical protein EF847_05415 [Actinobacteria bacterium YIM 96077]RAW18538.1 hypothetical protein DPM12_00100 [Phytoactinopolyspora halophila]
MPEPRESAEYTSIDVDALGDAVRDLDRTLDGLRDHISGLESDFDYFGVDQTNLNKLLEARNELEDLMPEMRQRHSHAEYLLDQKQNYGESGDGVLHVQGPDVLNSPFSSIEEAQRQAKI